MPRRRLSSNKKFLSRPSVFLILFIILGLIIISIFNHLKQQKVVDKENSKLEKKIVDLKQQNKEFEDLIKYFSESEYIEKEAREKLNLAKLGEKVVVFPKDSFASDVKNNQQDENNKNEFLPLKWWNYFFGDTDWR